MTTGATVTIAAGDMVTAGGGKSGYGFRATGTTDALKDNPSIGISLQAYAGGVGATDLEYMEAGVYEDPSYNFQPFRKVYVDDNSQLTQASPASTTAFRFAGIALSATKVLLMLPQPSYAREAAALRPMSIGDASPIPHQASATEAPLHKDFYGLGGPSAVQPSAHREVTAQYVDDTHLALKMMGDDGVVRSVTLTVA